MGYLLLAEIPKLEAQLTCISGQVLAAKRFSRVIIKLVGKDCKRRGFCG